MQGDSTASVLQVAGLCKHFGDKTVLRAIDFTLNAGESVVVLGGSGSGKSVFFKCIAGLMRADAGTVHVCGLASNPQNRAAVLKNIGMAFQGGALFDGLSVLENVAFGPMHGDGLPRAEAEAIAAEKIRAVDLDDDVFARYPAELSGGMQKRVALARATARNPKLFLFDEPTAGLDPVTGGVINRLIRDTVRKTKAGAITITHDVATFHAVADRAVLLKDGEFIWHGTPAQADADAQSAAGRFIRGIAYSGGGVSASLPV